MSSNVRSCTSGRTDSAVMAAKAETRSLNRYSAEKSMVA